MTDTGPAMRSLLALAILGLLTGLGLLPWISPVDVPRSIAALEGDRLGRSLRDVHLWTSHLLVAGAGLWLLARFPRAPYRVPGWPTRVALLVVVVLAAITGAALAGRPAEADGAARSLGAHGLWAAHCAALPLVGVGLAWRLATLRSLGHLAREGDRGVRGDRGDRDDGDDS